MPKLFQKSVHDNSKNTLSPTLMPLLAKPAEMMHSLGASFEKGQLTPKSMDLSYSVSMNLRFMTA